MAPSSSRSRRGSSTSSAIRSPCSARSSGRLPAVHAHRPDPRQVVQADLVDQDPPRVDVQELADRALKADGHVAEADRAVPGIEKRPGHDPDRIGEVDDPGSRCGQRVHALRDVEHDRHRAHRLGEARPLRSSPARCSRTRAARSRPRAAPPGRRRESDEHGSAPSSDASRSSVTSSRPSKPCLASIRPASPPTTSRRSGSMSWSQSS